MHTLPLQESDYIQKITYEKTCMHLVCYYIHIDILIVQQVPKCHNIYIEYVTNVMNIYILTSNL